MTDLEIDAITSSLEDALERTKDEINSEANERIPYNSRELLKAALTTLVEEFVGNLLEFKHLNYFDAAK